jgi:hypothetical protein
MYERNIRCAAFFCVRVALLQHVLREEMESTQRCSISLLAALSKEVIDCVVAVVFHFGRSVLTPAAISVPKLRSFPKNERVVEFIHLKHILPKLSLMAEK